ncbi:MAG: M28 family peptidase, partial [Candidatus Zixiibacteriota bacterium]
DFRTRLVRTDSSFAASEWLRQKYLGWGLPVVFDSYFVDTTWPSAGYERNVIASKPGNLNPSKIMIIGGHHDAIVSYTSLAAEIAPGADDNASGTAAALEAARIFRNYSWDPTIQFAGWGAEEFGYLGSFHYAGYCDSLDLDIGAVLCFDMIGYMDIPNLDCDIQRLHSAPLWLSHLFYEVGQTYVPALEIYEVTELGSSDWYPFAIHGFPSVGAMERFVIPGGHHNPHWHDTTDLLSTISSVLYTNIIKTGVATLAILSLYPGPVEDIIVTDIGNGSSLQVTWSASQYGDVTGYRVLWGTASAAYTDSHYIGGIASTVDTLNGLLNDSTYYTTVRAVDGAGHPSYCAYEVTGVPRVFPLAPSGVAAMPVISGVRIDWHPNDELDIAGYRLYRRINDNPLYDSLNTTLLTDTTYTDYPLSGANRYYYAVRAFDQSGYYSDLSAEAYGRPITLDQGVLVVDETRNSTNPPDSLQDAFYTFILDNYYADVHEYDSSQHAPVLADFVPYSSIVWFADDYIQNFASDHVNEFQTYLDLGGNLWFAGWRPTANLEGQVSYPFSFSSGDFMYDYFRVSNVAITAVTDSFQGADGLLSYPNLDVDPLKVPFSNWNGVLRYIEAVAPASGGETIYTMDMRNSTSPHQGSPCAVRYLGNDYKTVFFGFPMYFMDQDDARLAALKVMDDFGEVGVAETPKNVGAVVGILLQQNIPNPFTDQTMISYQITAPGNVRLKVYNIAGQLVKTLVNGGQEPGVYNIVWSGLDDQGRQVASGVYFCRLETDDHSTIKKMTILR